MKASRLSAALGLGALIGSGCVVAPKDDDADAGKPVFSAQGHVSGAGGGGVLAVVWSVTTASPDYAYRFGKAAQIGSASFIVSFSSEPPDAALNSDGIGVGYVALFPVGSVLTDGELPSDLTLLGFTARHAIIYRKPGSEPQRWWSSQFPPGYACGLCAPPPAGQSFEGYKPTVCTSLELVLSPGDSCSWT
jgi:hypothetical protein